MVFHEDSLSNLHTVGTSNAAVESIFSSSTGILMSHDLHGKIRFQWQNKKRRYTTEPAITATAS